MDPVVSKCDNLYKVPVSLDSGIHISHVYTAAAMIRTHSLIPQISTECLLWARLYPGHWRQNSEQKRQGLTSGTVCSLFEACSVLRQQWKCGTGPSWALYLEAAPPSWGYYSFSLFLVFEIGSCYVAQAGLDLTIPSTGIICANHNALLWGYCLITIRQRRTLRQ
jgi:hypothetical protein